MSRAAEIIADELEVAKRQHRAVKQWKSESTSPVPDNDTQMERIVDAIARHLEAKSGKKVRSSQLKEVAKPYGRKAARDLRAINPFAQDLITRRLLAAIVERSRRVAMVAVTLYHPDLNRKMPKSNDEIPAGYLEDLITVGRADFRKVFQGFSYIACFEVAIFRIEGHGESSATNYEVRPHHHAIVFADQESLERRLNKKFPNPGTGAGGSKVFKVDEISDLERWVRYMTKDPRCRYRDVQQLTRNAVREKWSAAQQMMVLQMYGDLTKTQLFTASSLGADIMKSVGGTRRLPHQRN